MQGAGQRLACSPPEWVHCLGSDMDDRCNQEYSHVIFRKGITPRTVALPRWAVPAGMHFKYNEGAKVEWHGRSVTAFAHAKSCQIYQRRLRRPRRSTSAFRRHCLSRWAHSACDRWANDVGCGYACSAVRLYLGIKAFSHRSDCYQSWHCLPQCRPSQRERERETLPDRAERACRDTRSSLPADEPVAVHCGRAIVNSVHMQLIVCARRPPGDTSRAICQACK